MPGKRCVVTGANRGLGREFIGQLLDRGDQVIAGRPGIPAGEFLDHDGSSLRW